MLSTSLEMRMRRREFLGLVGGAAAAWPLAARAQRTERVRRIGVLMSQASSDPVGQARNAAFVQGLQEAGWTIGGNVHIDYRWAAEDVEQSGRDNATELVALAPDVILATGGIGVEPLLQVTRTVPIVFVQVTDPVGAGYVESLARPGGNSTGFIPFEYSIGGKWLEVSPHSGSPAPQLNCLESQPANPSVKGSRANSGNVGTIVPPRT
jgi:putative ABC transport system substrate-binding protein